MSDVLLITFGCSWTWGVGAGYETSMTKSEYFDIGWNDLLCLKNSFRGMLCEKYNLDNKNFSRPGSSNQKQFRLAKHFFSSEDFLECKSRYKKIIVLWGITSTARNELFNLETQKLESFFLTDQDIKISKPLLNSVYNHAHEVWMLGQEMTHWNNYFKLLEIENFWFDTFNHHDYELPDPSLEQWEKAYQEHSSPEWPSWQDYKNSQFVSSENIKKLVLDLSFFDFAGFFGAKKFDNLLFDDRYPRDLMSQLSLATGLNEVQDKYHTSNWKLDSKRVEHLTNLKLLNPFTYHPTRNAHSMMADIIALQIENKFIAG